MTAMGVRRPSKGRGQIARGIVRRCHRYTSVYVKKLGLVGSLAAAALARHKQPLTTPTAPEDAW